ncbi:dTMP kinase [Candidatus Deferrimicrobium sp.]|uniref:dTMP kinase n=1 Tax=Candidatus Deferrimicrobium sp. TaxID=3060586 RepID=UPI00271CAFBE|nr:dTMP kinase [Candidatus Deferrimicrobium sp.]MDO8738299.1 dTMP kinase [Candidatus Deferrimicrobium sp.]
MTMRSLINDTPGKLIAVEGLDGSGKSTQVYLLKRWLDLSGYKVFFTEWNSSSIVREATRKGKRRNLLTPTTFSLIHCTDFADRYERNILPMLKAGFIVLADRYKFTALARDTVRGCSQEWVEQLYSFAFQPDITFYFSLPLRTALDRILSGRPALKYHEAGMDLGLSPDPVKSFKIFQGRIHKTYELLAKKHGFTRISSDRPVEAIQEEVRGALRDRIDLAHYKAVTRWIVR